MEQSSENALLNWDVFVTPGIPLVTRDLPPGVREAHFQAMASTLIYGMRDAVLVDTFMTVNQATALGQIGLQQKVRTRQPSTLHTVIETIGLESALFLNDSQMQEQSQRRML